MQAVLVDLSWGAASAWASTHGARVATILVLAFAANLIVKRVVPPTMAAFVLREPEARAAIDMRKRVDTLSAVIVHTAQIVVVLIAAFMILDELGFYVAPFLTGVGIGGIALGLGAQSLVRDTINGIFILAENQYGRGDLVTVGGVQGWVEDVNLRRTLLRDENGTMYTVPNGEVKVAGNLTRGYSGINLLVPLVAGSDVDRAMALIDAAGQEIADDPVLGPLVLETPRAVRLETITDKGLTIRVIGRALPGAQFEIAGALRRRIKAAFEQAQIRFGEAPPAPTPAPSSAGTGTTRPPA